MVVLSKQTIEEFPCIMNCNISTPHIPQIPVVDLSDPDCKQVLIRACEEVGFFKVVNHGVPMEFISKLESEAIKFFSLPASEKEKAGPASPYGYGSKSIGFKGDIGWLEYLLISTNPEFDSNRLPSVFSENPEEFRTALSDYISAVKKMACDILEMMADGLNIQPRNVFSKLLMDEQSDSAFRLNHYPPCPEVQGMENRMNMIGFGEHTDPQIIAVLRSNNTSGFEISLSDGSWTSVPPDQNSFFINVADSLQVMTNGRFKSVKHRVLANSSKSRVSMIYFGGPPLSEKIAPLPALARGEECLYKEFTWFEYKKSAYSTKLAHNRLVHFQKIAAS